MKDLIDERIKALIMEIEELNAQKEHLRVKFNDIEIRGHQLAGALYELNELAAVIQNQT